MPDTSVGVIDAAGATKQIDARDMTNGDLRQVVILGDPAADGEVAKVVSGALVVTQPGVQPPAADSTPTNRFQITPTTASYQVFPARTAPAYRKGASLYNASSGDIYVQFATTCAVGTADFIIAPGQLYELPVTVNMRIDTSIAVTWAAAATGTLRALEWF